MCLAILKQIKNEFMKVIWSWLKICQLKSHLKRVDRKFDWFNLI